MGTSKAELMFGGTTLLERVRAAAAPVFGEVITIVRDPDAASGSAIAEPPHDEPAPVYGVLAALRHASAKCVVIAVDYPLITSEVLAFVRDAFARSDAPLLVPIWSGRPQMLCAGYSPALLPLIEERIAGQTFDLRGLLELAHGEVIDEPRMRASFEGDPLTNVNTPEELRRAAELAGISLDTPTAAR